MPCNAVPDVVLPHFQQILVLSRLQHLFVFWQRLEQGLEEYGIIELATVEMHCFEGPGIVSCELPVYKAYLVIGGLYDVARRDVHVP